jgi:deazaflavin-dependent oxidoreductase (nitroreductase family)
MRAVLKLLGVVALIVGALGALFVVGMRQKSPPLQNAVKQASKASKSRVLRTAGTPGSGTAVVQHVGRSTGRSFETPVAVAATADGFVVALPYGPTTDWVRNVLASGSAVVVVEGDTHEVHRPEVVPMATIEDAFSPTDQRVHRLFKVDECLQVRHVASLPG